MRMLTRKLGTEAGAATLDILLASVNRLPRTTFMADVLRTRNGRSVGAQNSGLSDGPLCAPALGHNGHFHVASTAWNSVSLVCAFPSSFNFIFLQFSSDTMSTAISYCQCLLPSLTANVYCHLLLQCLLPVSTAISYCQCLLPSLTASVYCHLLLQCVLPVSTAISYCQCLLPFLTANVYCHLLLPVSSSFNLIFLQFSSDTK